jgi:hypothetical protein
MLPRYIFRIFTILGILAGIFFGPYGQILVQAQPAGLPVALPAASMVVDQNCWGLDLVFLVSQSTMANVNDPFNVRMDAVRLAIDALGENALFLCPGYTHRIAVIGFAQPQEGKSPKEPALVAETYIPLPGSSETDLIQPSLNNLTAWNATQKGFDAALPVKDLGYFSDYRSAFVAGEAQFAMWSGQKVDNLPRRRAVIVIGEGSLCTAAVPCNNYQKVMNDLSNVLDPGGTLYSFNGVDNPKSVVIYFLGIVTRKNAATQFFDIPAIFSFWKSMTNAHGGDLLILQRGQGLTMEKTMSTDLAFKMGNIMDKLLGSHLASNNCQPLWVNPYLSTFTVFHFSRRDAAVRSGLDKISVTIKGTQGNTVVAEYANGQTKVGSGKVIDYSNPANEQYVIYQTPPGIYSFSVSGADICQDIDIKIGQSGVTANILSPIANASFTQIDAAPYYDPANPNYFQVQLLAPDAQGVMQPFKELVDYPLKMSVIVKSQTSGLKSLNGTFPLVRVDEAKAIYATSDPILTRYPNVYSWVLTAETRNPRQFDPAHPDFAPIQIFQKEGVFTIGAISRNFNFTVQNLASKQEYALINGALARPLTVMVQVVNPDNTPFRVDQSIAPDGTSPFEALLTRPDGEALTFDLTQTDQNNFYSAQLAPSKETPTVYDPGCYTLVVRLKNGFDQSVFIPERMEADPISICLVPAASFTWKVLNPHGGVVYPLHPDLSLFPPPEELPIVIQVFDSSNHPLMGGLLQTTGKPVFAGVITAPGEGKGMPLTFSVDPKTGAFVADWPTGVSKEGQYTLRISLNSDNVAIAYYSQVNRLDPLKITRQDDLYAKPWFVPAAILISALLLLALLVWLARSIVMKGNKNEAKENV